MRRNLFCLFTAAVLMAQLTNCSEERPPKPEPPAPQPAAAPSGKPVTSSESPSTPSEPVASQVSSTPAQATQPLEEGRATPETQNAARQAAMERFQQMRKEPVPARPQ